MGGWGWVILFLLSLCIVNKNVCCEKEWGIRFWFFDVICLLLLLIFFDMIFIL